MEKMKIERPKDFQMSSVVLVFTAIIGDQKIPYVVSKN